VLTAPLSGHRPAVSASLIDGVFLGASRVRTPGAGESGTLAQWPLSVRLAEVAGRSPLIEMNVRLRRSVGHRARRLSPSWYTRTRRSGRRHRRAGRVFGATFCRVRHRPISPRDLHRDERNGLSARRAHNGPAPHPVCPRGSRATPIRRLHPGARAISEGLRPAGPRGNTRW
jgi:hypothetical protein